jgi:hypothetical protein
VPASRSLAYIDLNSVFEYDIKNRCRSDIAHPERDQGFTQKLRVYSLCGSGGFGKHSGHAVPLHPAAFEVPVVEDLNAGTTSVAPYWVHLLTPWRTI